MNGCELDSSSSFTQLGLSISSNLNWKPHILTIAKQASQKLGFLSRARGYLSPSQLLTIYKSQIRPSLEYSSHVWAVLLSLLSIFSIKSNLKQSISSKIQTSPHLYSLSPIAARRLVADLSSFYRYFHGHCSLEVKNIIRDPVKRVGTTRSSTQSRPFQITLPNP